MINLTFLLFVFNKYPFTIMQILVLYFHWSATGSDVVGPFKSSSLLCNNSNLLWSSFSLSVCLATSSDMVASLRGIAMVSICLRNVNVDSSSLAVSTWVTESWRLAARDAARAFEKNEKMFYRDFLYLTSVNFLSYNFIYVNNYTNNMKDNKMR